MPEQLERLYKDRNEFYHGTSEEFVPAILRDGLLPTDRVKAIRGEINHPGYSRDGVVYLAAEPRYATTWAPRRAKTPPVVRNGFRQYDYYHKVVLEVTVDQPVYKDRNLGTRLALEHHGPIPPERIRIHAVIECASDGALEREDRERFVARMYETAGLASPAPAPAPKRRLGSKKTALRPDERVSVAGVLR